MAENPQNSWQESAAKWRHLSVQEKSRYKEKTQTVNQKAKDTVTMREEERRAEVHATYNKMVSMVSAIYSILAGPLVQTAEKGEFTK